MLLEASQGVYDKASEGDCDRARSCALMVVDKGVVA